MYLQNIIHLHVSLLVLQFDGSLKRGRDPNEDIISKSVSSKYLSPFASSSSALFDHHAFHRDAGTRPQTIISLTGKVIPYHKELSSADVEYEGLILGLTDLLQHCSEHFDRDNDKILSLSTFNKITIQGDCKMIIDQMNQRSKPRKQRIYYDQARLIVSKLEEEYDLKLKFEHVLRDKNILCDYMCNVLIKESQKNETEKIIREIAEVEETYSPLELPSSKKRLFNFIETPFAVPLSKISEWNSYGNVPLSIRPYLLCEIYLACSRVEDCVGMRLVGEVMKVEAQRWKKQKILVKDGDDGILQQMDVIGSRVACSSLGKMGLKKEADKCFKSIARVFGTETVVDVLDEEVRQLQSQLPWLKSNDGNELEDVDILDTVTNTTICHPHRLRRTFIGWYERITQIPLNYVHYEILHS